MSTIFWIFQGLKKIVSFKENTLRILDTLTKICFSNQIFVKPSIVSRRNGKISSAWGLISFSFRFLVDLRKSNLTMEANKKVSFQNENTLHVLIWKKLLIKDYQVK